MRDDPAELLHSTQVSTPPITVVKIRKRKDVSGYQRACALQESDTPFRQVRKGDAIQGAMTGTHRWQERTPILDNPPCNGILRLTCLFDPVADKSEAGI